MRLKKISIQNYDKMRVIGKGTILNKRHEFIRGNIRK